MKAKVPKDSPFGRFQELAKSLIRVPKKEIEEKAEDRKKVARKNPANKS